MKITIALIGAVILAAITTQAQVTNGYTSFDQAIKALDITITNVSIDPYFTYAPKAPTKEGGGVFMAYDVNQFVGLGIGLDWLGQFALVSGDVQLQAPFHITTVFPALSQYSFFQNFEVTPFVLGGVATPYSGNGQFNGTPMVVSDVGGYVEFGHLLGGRFDVGAAWGAWSGSGPYAVKRYHAFAGWTLGF
jgi:hypothetical protein